MGIPTCQASSIGEFDDTIIIAASSRRVSNFVSVSVSGTPAWSGTSATVSRALREINDGYLDTRSVDELADRPGLGTRHLSRLFDEHLGTSPVAVAQTRRAHFARNLTEQTSLPLAPTVI